VRPGDWRVAAETADPFVKATAFVSPTKRTCVAVLINNSEESRKIILKLKGPEWADVRPAGFVTDAARTFKPQQVRKAGTTNSPFETTLSPKSISTFVWSRERVQPLRVLAGR
jgi:O-glycosyl hydrolase